MKHLRHILIAIALVIASLSTASRASETEPVATSQLVAMMAELGHWSENNLADMGLTKLVAETEEDEECGEFSHFVYGKNVKIKTQEGWTVTLEPTGEHACAVEVTLATDNFTKLYFKEKDDHDAFMMSAKQFNKASGSPYDDQLGPNLVESEGYIDGWYVITLHAG